MSVLWAAKLKPASSMERALAWSLLAASLVSVFMAITLTPLALPVKVQLLFVSVFGC